jgi:hypothetical protein
LKQCSNLHKNVKAATNKIHTLGFGRIKEWRRKTFSKIHPLGFGRIKEWREKNIFQTLCHLLKTDWRINQYKKHNW